MEKEKIEKNKFPNWSFRLNDDDGSCFLFVGTSRKPIFKVRANSISELMANPDVQPYKEILIKLGYYKQSEDELAAEQEQNHSEASDEHSEDEQVREYEEERTEDGKLIWLRDDYGSVYVYDIDKILDEIDSLKCLLDKQAITDTEFYFKCHKLINSYCLPF